MDQQEDDELVSNFSIARVNESMISTCPSYNMDLNMLVTLTQKFTESMQSRKCNKQMLANQLEQENIEMMSSKEKRAQRAFRLQSPHNYVIEKVAEYFNLNPEVVKSGVLDYLEYIVLMDSLFAEKGRKAIMFYYQDGEQLTEKEPELPIIEKRIYVTDGTSLPLNERATVCLRINNLNSINMQNIEKELIFTPIEVKNNNLVTALSDLLEKVYVPAINVKKKWDILENTIIGKKQVQYFLADLNDFQNFLKETSEDINNKVIFKYNEILYHTHLTDTTKLHEVSVMPEVIEAVERDVTKWIQTIEKEIFKSKQIRCDSDQVGPLGEIVYWKRKLSKLSSINDFIKSEKCNIYAQCLMFGRSKLRKTWKTLNNEITTITLECAEIVKYLYALEKFFQPLYRYNPEVLPECIPSLLHSIRLAYTTINSFEIERVCSLFVKCTNQMVNMCRKYITNDDTKSIWKQKKSEVIRKIQVCLDLYLKYYQCFQHTVKSMEEAGEEPFRVSQVEIFIKFEFFKKRIEKILEVLQLTMQYCILQCSTIEGVDKFANRFTEYFKIISNKKYDPLDFLNHEFDEDYSQFKQNIVDTELELEEFVALTLRSKTSFDSVLTMLSRFDKLNLPCLHLEKRYLEAVKLFEIELNKTRDIFNLNRWMVPSAYNCAPISGRIQWVRNLYERIAGPMKIFEKQERVTRHKNMQKCILLFNSLSNVFVHYEELYYRAWIIAVDRVYACLSSPILVKTNKNEMYLVNYDPFIDESIRECEYMFKIDKEVPAVGQIIHCKKEKLQGYHEKIKQLVNRNFEIRSDINAIFIPLLSPTLIELQEAFCDGLSTITWTSIKLPEFIKSCEKTLNKVRKMISEVNDMFQVRICEFLENLEETVIVTLPEDPVYSSELIKVNLERIHLLAQEFEAKSFITEQTSFHLINRFLYNFNEPHIKDHLYNWLERKACNLPESLQLHVDKNDAFKEIKKDSYFSLELIHEQCRLLFSYFNKIFLDALIKCIENSLLLLKKRETVSKIGTHHKALIKCHMRLQIPNAILVPSMIEIQSTYNSIMYNVLHVAKKIYKWGQSDLTMLNYQSLSNLQQKQNYYKYVFETKSVNRIIINLLGSTSHMNNDAKKHCQSFLCWSFLWDEKRDIELKAFTAKELLAVEIRERFLKYEQITESINKIEDHYCIGSIQVEMCDYKFALQVENNTWKQTLGKLLLKKYNQKLNKIIDYIKENQKVLTKHITNLEDVRLAMACLEVIRYNFTEMDLELSEIEEVFDIFNRFKINISITDIEEIEILRLNYRKMLKKARQVQEQIISLQEPFLKELEEGVAKFRADLIDYEEKYDIHGPMVPGISASEASDRVLIFQNTFDDLWERYKRFECGERLFGMEISDYPIMHAKKREFNLLNKLYGLYNQVNSSIDGYFDILWLDVEIEAINEELADFQQRCRQLPKGMKDWPAFIDLKQKIDDFNETCPLLIMMCTPAMKSRHWERIEKVTKHIIDVEHPNCTLRNVMEVPLLQYKDEIEDICVSAEKEKEIEMKLKQIIAEWAIVDLNFGLFKNRGELLLKGQDTNETIAAMEDSLMLLNSLLSNRYNVPYKKDIQLWVNKLITTIEILEKWMQVQNLWIYLEAVFVGGDISKQMPAEAKRFFGIDKSWVRIMMRAREVANVVETCTGDDMLSHYLPYLLEQLESCQKSLTGYLESKRLCFPRFFFISDPVLLEILGQSSRPAAIRPHLLSLFDAVANVEFAERNLIIAMASDLDERILLEKPVHATGGVEIWLNDLLSQVRETIKGLIGLMATKLKDADYDFIKNFPKMCGQAGLLGVQLLWTKNSEIALMKSRFNRTIMKKTNQYFLDLLNALIELTTRNISRMDRIRFETMVTIHLHQRDIFDDLVKLRIKSRSDFEWQKQARFYWTEETDDVFVRITDVDFLYQNEYMGVTERLAITPLTDRCYITLAQAIWMNMGGAPAGPAGTGKTETTKDMGRTLGKLVVVFNCSDQMDFRGLGRIFKGLAQSGSWGCFDEFNRIELPVLSVAAQQIYIVLLARKQNKKFFTFIDGDTVLLNMEFGIFLTMNPGYAGRQELPENLKIMFRTVAMMVPDRQIIIRVKLASCGFKQNTILARKFFTLYKLCEEQLSKQVHYDFGLRNILSVLRTLGAQKRANPVETEETVVMRVLRDMNVSKLVDEDEPLFLSLIEDMFPGIKLSTSTYKELQKCISNQTNQMQIINHPPWNLKVIQFYETSLVRHGLMILGPTGSGKTKCIHCLMRSLTEMGKPHREMRMNPKAISAPQMFGRLDVATNDWTDGIFSALWRKTHKIKKSEVVWLVLDGPVDAVWIENLNSVLDDNKTLTLANGDRIIMAPNSKILFEPDNVDNASPATISRMGMVFISASVLKWQPILNAWLLSRQPAEVTTLNNLFNSIYDDAHSFVQIKLKPTMDLLEVMYIRQCCDIITGLLSQIKEDESIIQSEGYLSLVFLFALMWSLGAVLELDDRDKLEEFLLLHPSRLPWPIIKQNESLFDFNASQGYWQHWSEKVEQFTYPDDSVLDYNSILVPNVDNVRSAFLLDLISRQKKAVLFIGEQGTAKTVMIKSYLSQYDPEFELSKSINFSSATSPNMFQKIVESYVDKRIGFTYGPPNGKLLTIFVDDINMPRINEWGDQITNELVRQLMETSGFYSLDKPGEFFTLLDIQFIAAMNHPGGGRNDIPPRLKRQFCVFNCTLPSKKSMDQIFSNIGEGYFSLTRFPEQIVDIIPIIVPLTRHVWQQTKNKMLPTPAKFHYVFNLRDLSRIWQGILTIQGAECQEITTLLKLWRHECIRVIADRFTENSDKEWFLENLTKLAMEELSYFNTFYTDEEVYFVDFMRDCPEATGEEPEGFVFEAPKIYEEMDNQQILERVLMNMGLYNENVRGSKMDLVFFHDALVNLIIVSRIIRTPRGNALLVGVGGSGKQSLTRLASFIADYITFQISISRVYNVSNLMDDLKFLYRSAGYEGTGTTFLFTDNEIKEESFLEYINNLISSGEIANLFAKDELDEIQTNLIPKMRIANPKQVATNDNLYEFFITRAKNNLHVVLCFSPIGEKFRSRALKFPGLISGCTIKWFYRWPKDALIAVAKHYLQKFTIVCTPGVKDELIDMMADTQNQVAQICVDYFDRFRRQTHVTPKSYLSFLNCYKTIYAKEHRDIKALAVRLNVGLSKLVEAAASVEILKTDLAIQEQLITVANEEAAVILEDVLIASESANKVKEEATAVKETAEVLVENINVEQKNAEVKLRAAEPALLQAEAALQTIKGSDIATIRKLGKPPYLITLIMDAVLIYFKKKLEPITFDYEKYFLVPSWSESLKMMADVSFLKNLKTFPKDQINAETIDLLTPYFNSHLYTYAQAKQACGNVAGLIQWTMAMASFYKVNKDVLPLKAHLARQTARYISAQKQLSNALKLLEEKEAEVAECQARFDVAMNKKQIVQETADKCQAKMNAATNLITGLSDEKIRWTGQIAEFNSEIIRLTGNVLILAGFLSYAGPFNQDFRINLLSALSEKLIIRKIPSSSQLNIVDTLIDTATIGEWNLQGLPSDELSIQNGIIVTKADRFPLLIDPQSQGKTWIKKMEKKQNLIVTTLNNKYFRNQMEDAISLGLPIIIEDIDEELDPSLDNVLEKNHIKIGLSYKVKFGDKEIDIHENLRIYITTKLPNPSYSPEIFARTSIIDFTVTMKGLEDQLLGRVIQTEKKELEIERINLLLDVLNNKRKMKELEQNLLYKLTTVKGSLIEDESVIGVLNVTKKTANEVEQKLKIAKVTEVKINAAREEFRSVATRGSVLYFLIVNMAMVNCMYQTSLIQFLERFDLSMERSDKSPVPARRVNYINEYMTYEIYKYKCRGLYECHKYLFLLLMTLNIDMKMNSITHDEYLNFIRGGAALELNECPHKPAKWITDITWLNLVQLSNLEQFKEILKQVETNERAWKKWFDSPAPEENCIPDDYNILDMFRKLLIIRAWCPDRTIAQSRKYIANSLGEKFIEPIVLNMDVLYEESNPIYPIICFLNMGSDPTTQIEQLAKKNETLCMPMSMGQGQEVHARKLITSAMEHGYWALMQNCHLGMDYMTEVFLQMKALNPDQVHSQFRLWLTTEPHPQFPISLLQICIKFTNEPPAGIRAGLKRTYTSMNQEFLDYSDNKQYLPLVYAISYLHTVVQERRKFGPLGWNIPYEFNSADWLASCMFIQNHLEEIEKDQSVCWNSVRYMLGEVQYGGRVTDDYDKRLLNTFTKVWFTEVLFDQAFNFYEDYRIMRHKSIQKYLDEIEFLPGIDPPQAYGLHPNADISYQSNIAANMLETIVAIQPKESSGSGGETRETQVARQALDMLDKLPMKYDPYEVKERLVKMGLLNSMTIFLRQEIDRMQKVIILVGQTLKDLLLSIDGIIIMNETLRDTLDSIYDARVPNIWKRGSWVSSTLGFWFTELLERNMQFRYWCFQARPHCFWMTGFFNPQGFLTAMKQEVARAHKGWALDQISLHNNVLKAFKEEVKSSPAEGVYIYGLYLDGAGWDKRFQQLCESANKVLYATMPVIHVYAINSVEPKDSRLYQVYPRINQRDGGLVGFIPFLACDAHKVEFLKLCNFAIDVLKIMFMQIFVYGCKSLLENDSEPCFYKILQKRNNKVTTRAYVDSNVSFFACKYALKSEKVILLTYLRHFRENYYSLQNKFENIKKL